MRQNSGPSETVEQHVKEIAVLKTGTDCVSQVDPAAFDCAVVALLKRQESGPFTHVALGLGRVQ